MKSSLQVIGLVLLGLIAYWGVWDHEVLLDRFYLSELTQFKQEKSAGDETTLGWAFEQRNILPLWNPLNYLSLALDLEFWGDIQTGPHVTSLALHILTTLILFSFLGEFLRRPFIAWTAAALFMVHTLNLEAVGWVAARKFVLCGFFSSLTLLCYLRFAEADKEHRGELRGRIGLFLLTLICLVGALLSSGIAFTLPLVLVGIDWHLGRNGFGRSTNFWHRMKRQFAEKWAFFFLMGVTFLAVKPFRFFFPYVESFMGNFSFNIPFLGRPAALGYYLQKAFYPSGLNPSYPFPPGKEAALLATAGWIVILLAFGVVWKNRRRMPEAFVGMMWFLLLALPACGIGYSFVVDRSSMRHEFAAGFGLNSFTADREIYLAMMGLCVMVPAFFVRLTKKRSPLRYPTWIIFMIPVLLLCFTTRASLQPWKKRETLFAQILERNPNLVEEVKLTGSEELELAQGALKKDAENPQLWFELALLYQGNKAMTPQERSRLTQEHFQRANELTEYKNPRFLYNNAGFHYIEGNIEQALKLNQTALQLPDIDPDLQLKLDSQQADLEKALEK